MRLSQYFIRLVVFSVVALDPSGGSAGVVLAVGIGVAIGAADVGINAVLKKARSLLRVLNTKRLTGRDNFG